MEEEIVFYDRKMGDGLVKILSNDGYYKWLIPYVKNHPELDFQTGHDAKSGRSWFSIYKGTGRIFTISSSRGGKISSPKADKKYMSLSDAIFNRGKIDEFTFNEYLKRIEYEPKLDRYYISKFGEKEGYYQTLISRRYTINTQYDDDFIIADKEMVIGFKDEIEKKQWNDPIENDISNNIVELRKQYVKPLPKIIQSKYGEFDFLGVKWNGDLLIMELKQDDASKTALSPIQVGYYYKQLKKLIEQDKKFFDKLIEMVKQKVDLGLIRIPNGKSLPKHFSGNIDTCVIIGNERGLSSMMCERYRIVRDLFMPNMVAYKCKDHTGSIVECDLLNK